MEEITVEIRSLLHHICKKWRLVLVWMIFGAVLADAAAVAKNIRNVKNWEKQVKAEATEGTETTELEEENALRAGLTQKEVQEVENAAASYLAYVKSGNRQLAYYDESILMKLDANKVPTLTLQYYVDNGYKAEYPVAEAVDNAVDIGNALGNYASSDNVCSQISEKLDWNKESVYIKELITFVCEEHTLTITVVAPETEDCKTMGEIVKAQIRAAEQELQQVYGEFEAKLALEENMVTASQMLMTQQTTQLTNMYSSKSDFRTSISSFTEEQKNYYNAIINNAFVQDETPSLDPAAEVWETDETEEPVETEESAPTVQYIHLKYIVLGILAGAFLCVCWICVTYIGSGLLRTPKDIKEGFDLQVIGTVHSSDQNPGNPIDGLIEWIFRKKGPRFSREEQLHMAAAAIRIGARKAEMNKLYITSAANDEATEQLREELAALLEKQQVRVQTGAPIVYDPESLECMSACDGLVLVESVGYSLYRDILTEKQLSEGSHVPIIGAVVRE